MTSDDFGKDEWVELFRAVGLTDAQMHDWHARFEQSHPDAHQRFLLWLGIEQAEIDRIRRGSQAP